MAKKKVIDLKAAIALINDSEEDSVPKEIYATPDLYLALIEGEEPYSAIPWLVCNYMPDSLKADRKLMTTLMKHDQRTYEYIDDSLKSDKELFEMAIEADLELFEYAADSIKSDSKIVADFLKRWLNDKPGSLIPVCWISKDLIKKNKFIEASGAKFFSPRDGYNRFVIDISQEEVSDDKSDAVLAKHISFVETFVKDKKAILFDEIHQTDNSGELESVSTFACVYIKDETLEDMDNYLNNLAAKKIRAASAIIYDIDNPNYMNYSEGEVSSGSIDSDDPDAGMDVINSLYTERRNLNSWPIKILDNY